MAASMLLFASGALAATPGNPLLNPPVFASDPVSHVLNLLMVAKPLQVDFPFGQTTTGWAYEVCPRPATSVNECPAGTGVQPFGGIRWALQKGDTIRLRLVNQLPVITDSKHCSEPGHADLVNNPTNLHTHGMLVEPHRAQGPHDAYGDYVFLEIRNPANHGTCPSTTAGAAQSVARAGLSKALPYKICTAASPAGVGVPGALHADMDVLDTAAEYSIHVGATHPSGLFWFHPHLHGISLNQITSGMAGMITVGGLADICTNPTCKAEVAAGQQQFMTLKDTQVDANGTLIDQQNAGFCNGSNEQARTISGTRSANPLVIINTLPGFCLEVGKPGRWFHTINGQVYPTVGVGPHGSVWRILNAAASRSYDLSLVSSTGAAIPMQILSVDGVTIESSTSADAVAARRALVSKATTVPCPGAVQTGVCVLDFKMMPSARIELRVINPAGQAQAAVFQTAEYLTGPVGDDWPAIYLAAVNLAAPAAGAVTPLAVGGARTLLSDRGALGQTATIELPGTNEMVAPAVARAAFTTPIPGPILEDTLRQTPSFAISPETQNGLRRDPACKPLAKGHRRRIYFGYPTTTNFGLGYVELDENGNEVAGTEKPVVPFDPTKATICLPLAQGNRPTNEIWELINLTAEDHNFHIHQSRFRVLSIDSIDTPPGGKQVFVVHDNIPLRHGTAACDGTLATAEQQGSQCKTGRTVVEITFDEIGDFVYHCHIMEHEDGGMMARIRVVPNG